MKKVAVVNRTNLINYGSVLQSYALHKAIIHLGYESSVVWEKGTVSKNRDFRIKKLVRLFLKLLVHPPLWKDTVSLTNAVNREVIDSQVAGMFDSFVKDNIKTEFYEGKALKNIAKTDEYYKFVCGSDQVWCSTSLYADPLMYLRFAPESKRVAYAPSIGRDYIPSYNKRVMRKYINGIPSVSIREETGKRLIYELTGRDVPVTLDPTLLLERREWEKLMRPAEYGRYMLCYFLSPTTENIQLQIADIAKRKGLTVVSLGEKLPLIEKECEIIRPKCGPCDFLGCVCGAECVITDSYHGMIFSMIFEREFYSVERRSINNNKKFDQSSRQKSLLNRLGINERYIETENGKIVLTPVNYGEVNAKIQKCKNDSLEFLGKALAERD